MSKHQLAPTSMDSVTCALPGPYYLHALLHFTSIYASGDNYIISKQVQREHCHELEQHKMSKKVRSLVPWKARKYYLLSAVHRWLLKRNRYFFYPGSKML